MADKRSKTDQTSDFDFRVEPGTTDSSGANASGKRRGAGNGNGAATPKPRSSDSAASRRTGNGSSTASPSRGRRSAARDGDAGRPRTSKQREPVRPGKSASRDFAKESRHRAARRRVEGKNRVEADDVPFESLLDRQPQRGAIRKSTSPLIDAAREARSSLTGSVASAKGALSKGKKKARATGAAVRTGELRQALPTTRRKRSLAPGETDQVGGRRSGTKQSPRHRTPTKRAPRKAKPGRLKPLRVFIVVGGLGLLAIVSVLFGMMMAISRKLPELENKRQYATAQNTEVYDVRGRPLGTLLSNDQRYLVTSEQISPYVKSAVVAIEDERFYEHRGVDYQGLARAAVVDLIPGGSTQGASTITQQFVKNALETQNRRTVFEKLRESALAYHLERKWDKDKILTQYLNTVYFGEGAYGIEAAARTYFGYNHPGCGEQGQDPCSNELLPEEAALLAALINSPSAFSPRVNPQFALERRNVVLQKMNEQGVLSAAEYQAAKAAPLPAASEIQRPQEDSKAPYFTTWMRQILVDKFGPGTAFSGGLRVRTSLDLQMQDAASQIASDSLAGVPPTSAVVVLDNDTGEVRAMVGGNDFENRPFNLATQGYRQPGSTFKTFVLATALAQGRSPSEVFSSQPKQFPIPGVNPNKEMFVVKNYDDNYLGSASIATATQYSDNSVFAELGLQLGTKKIARMAQDMGIETKVSTNPAMTLGGLDNYCCTPLEMTHAYQTLAAGGNRISGTLDSLEGDVGKDPRDDGPVPLVKITDAKGDLVAENKVTKTRVLSSSVANTEKGILQSVISGGTGTHAATGGYAWGKTGTTENYGDAWFCGGSEHFTACVWVGYPDSVKSMETEYGGSPVAGGTYPAEIWSRVIQALEAIQAGYGSGGSSGSSSSSSSYTPSYSAPATPAAPATGGGGGGQPQAPAASPAPSSGGGGVGL